MTDKTVVKALSGIDGSVLAVIAQTPDISEEQLKSLLDRASPDAKEIARKMIALRQQEKKEESQPSTSTPEYRPRNEIMYVAAVRSPKPKVSGRATKDATTTQTARAILNWANMNTKVSI